jgi:hypothetical protein
MLELNSPISLFEIYTITSPDSYRKLRYKLSNFLEMILVLKGIKSGFAGRPEDINLQNVIDILPYIHNVSHELTYFPKMEMIVHTKHAIRVLGNKFDSDSLMLSSLDYKQSKVIGALLGYPCLGVSFKQTNKQRKSVSYWLETSQLFRDTFKYKHEWLDIIGFVCDEYFISNKQRELNAYEIQLNEYFNDTLHFGKVRLFIK